MGFIRKKKVKKYTYYYYVEKERRDGKPVDSVHIYLGTADEIMNKINKRSESRSTLTLKTFEYLERLSTSITLKGSRHRYLHIRVFGS